MSLRLLSEHLVFDGAQPGDAAAFLSLIPVVERYRPTERAVLTAIHLQFTTAEPLDDIGDVFEASPDIEQVHVRNIDDREFILPTIVDAPDDHGEPPPHPPFTRLTLSREEATTGNWSAAWNMARSIRQVNALAFTSESRPLLDVNIHDARTSTEAADTLWPLLRELLEHHDRVNIVNHADERGETSRAYNALIPSCSTGRPRAVADGALYEELELRAVAEC